MVQLLTRYPGGWQVIVFGEEIDFGITIGMGFWSKQDDAAGGMILNAGVAHFVEAPVPVICQSKRSIAETDGYLVAAREASSVSVADYPLPDEAALGRG